jgi:hypothetical protein
MEVNMVALFRESPFLYVSIGQASDVFLYVTSVSKGAIYFMGVTFVEKHDKYLVKLYCYSTEPKLGATV